MTKHWYLIFGLALTLLYSAGCGSQTHEQSALDEYLDEEQAGIVVTTAFESLRINDWATLDDLHCEQKMLDLSLNPVDDSLADRFSRMVFDSKLRVNKVGDQFTFDVSFHYSDQPEKIIVDRWIVVREADEWKLC